MELFANKFVILIVVVVILLSIFSQNTVFKNQKYNLNILILRSKYLKKKQNLKIKS